jgi:hypothetical protein
MKSSRFYKSLMLGLTLLLAASAFASSKGSLQLSEPVNVAGKQLPAGDYSLRWEGNGPNVELSILKGKAVVTKAPARLVDLSRSASSDAAVTKINSDGSRSLSEIRFSGKKQALAIGEESAKSSPDGNQ